MIDYQYMSLMGLNFGTDENSFYLKFQEISYEGINILVLPSEFMSQYKSLKKLSKANKLIITNKSNLEAMEEVISKLAKFNVSLEDELLNK